MAPSSGRVRYAPTRVLVTLLTLLLAGPAFAQRTVVLSNREPLIVGVTDVGPAVAALRAQGVAIRHVIDVSRAIAVVGNATALRALPFVRYVEPDPPDVVWTQEDALQYGVNNIDAEVVWGGSQGATSVTPGQGGAGIRVAVIDTGIDCGHPDLQPVSGAAGACIYGYNSVSSSLPFDDHGHGTHVAGIIGARDNGIGVIGVAPEADLYAVKVLNSGGSGAWSTVAAGINWAVLNGMHLISMSLGGTDYSQAMADAVAAAQAAGILVVSAAGNSGCCNTVLYPAKYPESMAVAAVDQSDLRASFSSTGPELDVAAPGVAVLSTVPTGSCMLCDPSGYKSLSGTSMATPHVTGVGALLMAGGRTNLEAWSLISGTAKDLGDAGFDQLYGNGRVDALAAVDGTPAPPPPPPPGDGTPPTVSITSPADGTEVARRSDVTLAAAASDNVGVMRVDVYVNGSLKCSLTASPYTCTWRVPGSPNRTYKVQARATDAAGNVGTSAIVNLTGQ